MHGANDVACIRRRNRTHGAGDAEIGDLDAPVLHHEDVVRFDVAVDKTVLVRMMQSLGNLTRNGERRGNGQASARIKLFAQGLPRNVFHNDVVGVSLLPDIIDIDDVGMRHLRGSLRFGLKACYKLGVTRELGVQHLDCDRSIEQFVVRLIYISHAAASNKLHKLIAIA